MLDLTVLIHLTEYVCGNMIISLFILFKLVLF